METAWMVRCIPTTIPATLTHCATNTQAKVSRRKLRYTGLKAKACLRCRLLIVCLKISDNRDTSQASKEEDNVGARGTKKEDRIENWGVELALIMLRFYKSEISPFMPSSCRYIPTCSEYSMMAYKRYGVVKGTILTAWRLCRCNPLGGSGYDPPRWFGENSVPPPS